MTGRLERKFQTATPTMAGSAFGCLSAVFAHWFELLRGSWNACAVNILVAGLANGYPVRNIISKFGVIVPGLDVMRLDFVVSTAFLAGAVISAVYGISPLAVLAGVALFVGILLSFRCVPAFLATVLLGEFPGGGDKLITAVLASELGRLSVKLADALTGAGSGTCFPIEINPPLEGFAANYAGSLMAGRAIVRAGIVYGKRIAAPFTVSLDGECLSVHTSHYNIIRLERWSTMTGQTPTLIGTQSDTRG